MTRSRFLVGFLLVALAIAGGLSYLASPEPDGLDSVTLNGCEVIGPEERLEGTCIARNATEHGLAGSPLADYAVGGRDGTTGIAGVMGVLVTAGVAVLLFPLLRGPRSRPGGRSRS